MKTASWIIKELDSGRVILETFDSRVVARLNTDKYIAIPIVEYLQNLNKTIKINR